MSPWQFSVAGALVHVTVFCVSISLFLLPDPMPFLFGTPMMLSQAGALVGYFAARSAEGTWRGAAVGLIGFMLLLPFS